MQTTLLGLAVTLILALVTALVGPHLVDWTRYRSEIEAQATRIVGAPVEVSGPIDVRLLPTPSLALHSVAVSAGNAEFSTRSLRFELALGALLRGEWQVSELTLDEPHIRIALDRTGALPPLGLAMQRDPERLAIARLVIADGSAVLTDVGSDRTFALEKLSFNGDLRSLVGPLRGDGRFAADGSAYRFRLSTGRGSGEGVKVRLGIDRPDWPLTAEADGMLSVDDGRPRYDGTLALSGPAGAVLADGRALVRDPWRATGHVRADATQAVIEDFELNYGPEDRLLRLSGRATIALAPAPRFDVAFTGHQMLLDRWADPADAVGGAPLRVLSAMLGGMLKSGPPPLPGKLDLTVDQVTFAGSTVQNVQATAVADADGWTVTVLDFRAPGATQIQLGGRLRAGAAGLAYAGPVRMQSAEPGALLSFVEGKADGSRPPPIGPFSLSGEAAIDNRGVRVERLHVEIDGKPIEGTLAYTPATDGQSGRLEATLAAPEIDLDSAVAIAKGTLAGVSLEWPRTIALALGISRLTYAGVDAGRVDAKLKLDPNGLAIERFTIGDLRGASVTATGLVDIGSPSPQGTVSVALAAARTEGLAALVSRFAPQAASEISRYANQLGSAELRARLDIAPARSGAADRSRSAARRSQAKFLVDGKIGAVRVNLIADALGEKDAPAAANVKVTGSVEADDGRLLAALTGVDRLATIEARPALLTLSAQGAIDSALACDLRLAAGGVSAAATGTLRLGTAEWSGQGNLTVAATDGRPLLSPSAKTVLPVTLDGRVAFAGRVLTIETLKGRIADSDLTARLALNFSAPMSIDGRVDTTEMDVGSVIAVAVASPRRPATDRPSARGLPGQEPGPGGGLPAPGPAVIWAAEPFATPLFTDLYGRIAFTAERAALLPGLLARDVKGSARLGGPTVTLENLSGTVADGPFTADATIQAAPAGLALQASLSVAKADLAQIDFGRGKPPASGSLTLSGVLRGAGRSPATLIGALNGSGRLSLENVQISGLDPMAVDAAIGAAERGLPLERLSGYLGPALDAGKLAVPAAATTIEIIDGQVRVAPMIVRPGSTEVVLSAAYNLATDMLDAQVTLAGMQRKELQDQRPEVALALRGPLSAPERSIEAGALLSFVTLQAVERQAGRVEAAEREARRRDAIAATRERAAKQRLEDMRRGAEQRQAEDERRGAGGGAPDLGSAVQQEAVQRNATAPIGDGVDAEANRAPALPPPVEIKPQPVPPIARPVPTPRARPLPREPVPQRAPAHQSAPAPQRAPAQQTMPAQQWAPPRRSFWDELFGGRR